MAIAAAVPGRDLTTAECRTYLHASDCPAAPAADGVPTGLAVYTSEGVIPIDRLAAASLAGTRVDLVTQLPGDAGPKLADLANGSGIEVQATQDDASGTILSQRVAAGDLPDVAIVARPEAVAGLARAGLLVDLSGFADRPLPDDSAGAYLRSLVTIGPGGWWPATSGTLVGAPLATTHESLVWYPEAAFAEAGYRVPGTSGELAALVDRIEADGGAAWCLGFLGGAAELPTGWAWSRTHCSRSAARSTTTHWPPAGRSSGSTRRRRRSIVSVTCWRPGTSWAARTSALRTPPFMAAWPMFHAQPGCWLHPGGGADRLDWPKGETRRLAAFPAPKATADSPALVRGHLYTVVVFHDRPEVRRLVASLSGPGLRADPRRGADTGRDRAHRGHGRCGTGGREPGRRPASGLVPCPRVGPRVAGGRPGPGRGRGGLHRAGGIQSELDARPDQRCVAQGERRWPMSRADLPAASRRQTGRSNDPCRRRASGDPDTGRKAGPRWDG